MNTIATMNSPTAEMTETMNARMTRKTGPMPAAAEMHPIRAMTMSMKMMRMIYAMMPVMMMMWMAPLLGACSTGTMARTGEHAGSSIRIGSGGGFSGIFSGFLFNADGSVYKWKIGPGEFKENELLFTERDSVTRFFSMLEEIGFTSYMFDHPGNMTRFMELAGSDSLHTIRWGEPGVAPPMPIAELHDSMLSFARRRSSTTP